MDRIRIIGGERLKGTIPISGAKNAALALDDREPAHPRDPDPASNVPRLADVTLLGRILGNHGVDITVVGKKVRPGTIDGQTFKLKSAEIVDTTAPYEMVSRMRASFWVLAPLLARCGEAKVSLPGGCAIGTRPVDLHLTALEALGADDRARRRLCHRQGAEGSDRRQDLALQGLGRRHPQCADGRRACPRRHRDRERRARARSRRPRNLPQEDGRQDRRHRQRDLAGSGR